MFYVIFISLLVLTDQMTKYLIVKNLVQYESVSIINNILCLTYVRNTGGPWSLFSSVPMLFIIMTVVVLVAGFVYFKKHPPKNAIEKISICLIAGGAIGNFIDRITRGYVVDMIDVNFFDYPVFNIADCFIVVGAILFCICIIFLDKESDK